MCNVFTLCLYQGRVEKRRNLGEESPMGELNGLNRSGEKHYGRLQRGKGA
jgi:hypothetical protein